MDTKKALSAIIILLVLMNITLGAYIIVINSGKIGMEDTLEYTKMILQNRNYSVDCAIPKTTFAVSAVTFGENRFTEQSLEFISSGTGGDAYIEESSGILYYISKQAGNPVSGGTTRTEVESSAARFMESIGINREEFTLDYYRESSPDTYSLKYIAVGDDGSLLFGSYVEMQITEEGVQSARILYPEIVEETGSIGEGLPVYTILLANLTKSNKEVSIESINPGYYFPGPGTVNISWRVRFGDGNERFFDAATGIEIK